jgi:hypothetical protein
MKDTIKNSIIGAFAIFGLVALISSSNTAPTVIHEGSNTPESHVWEFEIGKQIHYLYNKKTGEVRTFDAILKDRYYHTQRKMTKLEEKGDTE